MSKILVSGLINIETTVKIDGFPITYTPVRYPFFGVNSSVSGVGYNIAKALTTLGLPVHFLSMVGRDLAAQNVYAQLKADQIPFGFVISELEQTSCSAILYDPSGRRMINVDLKNVQERAYPPVLFEQAAQDVSLAVLCNINFSRPFLSQMRERGVPVITDVHTISDLDDSYNRDFMAAANILFMSDERLPCPPEDWVRLLWDRNWAEIAVVGLGSRGALLAVRRDNMIQHIPAVQTRPVVNTIGAGDALFSSFVAVYHQTGDPYLAIRKAVVFASYKIGTAGAADGFLDAAGLDRLFAEVSARV
ncbi:MAG: carbohydrate kinase family protein [Chloroflexi bacterium]|nr:carbohydrate kinase family protein [Chloroflexota bacterium]